MNRTHDIYMEIIVPIVLNIKDIYRIADMENDVNRRVYEILMRFPVRQRMAFILWYDSKMELEDIALAVYGTLKDPKVGKTHTSAANWFRDAEENLRLTLFEKHSYVWVDKEMCWQGVKYE